MSTETYAADWYPDPAGRHEFRWFDRTQWTERVESHGREGVDSLDGPHKTVAPQQNPEKVSRQVQNHLAQSSKRGAPTGPVSAEHGVGLLDHPVLVINQKWKLIEVNSEFAIMDPNGVQVGAAWKFSIKGEDEQEVARITKTWEGLLKTAFTTADNYVLQGPLHLAARSVAPARPTG